MMRLKVIFGLLVATIALSLLQGLNSGKIIFGKLAGKNIMVSVDKNGGGDTQGKA
jgi:hypothetical protein